MSLIYFSALIGVFSPYVALGINVDYGNSTCGHFRHVGSNIIGGRDAKRGEVPWQTYIPLNNHKFGGCGGTIVDRTHVITAAHCIPSDWQFPVERLVVGNLHEFEQDKHVQEVGIVNIAVHPKYRPEPYFFDIAIIKTEPIELNEWVKAACLPERDTQIAVGELLRVSGFGDNRKQNRKRKLRLRNKPHGTKLKLVDVPFHNDTTCTRHLDPRFYNGDQMFCAGAWEGGADSCQGDSGGPIVKIHNDKATLVGVVSFGKGCARPKLPGIYSDVRYYMDWIAQNW